MSIVDLINKKHGKKTIESIDSNNLLKIDRISTGSLAFDSALGGGIPEGRITILVGKESSGKTTIATHIMANAQKKYSDKKVALVEVEFAYDLQYAKYLGLNVDDLIFTQPTNAHEAWDIVSMLAESGEVSLIVLDSLAQMLHVSEDTGDFGDSHMGLNARLNGQALRKLNKHLKNKNVSLILTNQWKSTIGGFGHGPKRDMPGGKAPKFAASIIVDISRTKTTKINDIPVSNTIKVKCIKNKTFAPYRETTFDIVFGQNNQWGIDYIKEIIDYATKFKLITTPSKGRYEIVDSNGEIHKKHGANNLKKFLIKNPEILGNLTDKVMERVNEINN